MALRHIAKGIEILHILVVFLYLFSIYFLVSSDSFRIISSFYLLAIGISTFVFRECPLTVWENKILESLGIRLQKRRFIQRTLKKYFNVEFKSPSWFLNSAIFFFSIVSLIVILIYYL